MIVSQEQLLEEGERLENFRRSYDRDEAVDESYVVLTIGANLIATLGLLANNAAVVIGAMVRVRGFFPYESWCSEAGLSIKNCCYAHCSSLLSA